jgi:dodecin
MAVAKIVEISGASPKSFEDAIRDGALRATKAVRNIQAVWVDRQKVKKGERDVSEWQVVMKVAFVLDE